MILDTSFVIDVLRGDQDLAEQTEKLDAEQNFVITSVTLMELWKGIEKSGSGREEEKVKEFLKGLNKVNFGNEAAKIAGSTASELEEKGEMIEIEDIMIASIAKDQDRKLLTGNSDHFTRIKELEVKVF